MVMHHLGFKYHSFVLKAPPPSSAEGPSTILTPFLPTGWSLTQSSSIPTTLERHGGKEPWEVSCACSSFHPPTPKTIFEDICRISELGSFPSVPVLDTVIGVLAIVCCCVSHTPGLSEVGMSHGHCLVYLLFYLTEHNILHKDGTLCFITG